MKLKVQQTSGPSHQVYANGKPCDRYIGTVYFTGATYGCHWMRFTKQVIASTPETVEKKLEKYRWGLEMDIDKDELDPEPRLKKGDNNANA